MMSDPAKNIMAATVLASIAIMLSSLIAVLMSNGFGSASGSRLRSQGFVVGTAGSDALTTAKFFAMLSCFVLSFLFHVQCVRYYSHAGMLINVPMKDRDIEMSEDSRPLLNDEEYAGRGGLCWSLGVRAFYFSFPLSLWLFGPIPLVVCCVAMVITLYFLDESFDDDHNTAVGSGTCYRQ